MLRILQCSLGILRDWTRRALGQLTCWNARPRYTERCVSLFEVELVELAEIAVLHGIASMEVKGNAWGCRRMAGTADGSDRMAVGCTSGTVAVAAADKIETVAAEDTVETVAAEE